MYYIQPFLARDGYPLSNSIGTPMGNPLENPRDIPPVNHFDNRVASLSNCKLDNLADY